MPQEKRYGSAAERQKAYRERKLVEATVPEASLAAQQEEPEAPAPVDPPAPEEAPPETLHGRSLASYILECRGLAAQEAERDLLAGVTGRLERAETYARWRWDGVKTGQVAGL